MFQFTTTTVINNFKADDYQKVGDVVNILKPKMFTFDKNCVVNIVKAPFTAEAVDEATVSFANYVQNNKIKEDIRISLYIRSVGNADPMYANDLVFKGKPFYLEIPKDTPVADIKKMITKYYNLTYGGVDALEIVVDGTDLTIKGTNPYQRITKAVLQNRSNTADTNGEFTFEGGEQTPMTVTMGNEGFGTYDKILKDLRLPTAANLRWKRTMEDEMPAVGGEFNQYIITYCKKRGVMGLGAVGQLAKSFTTHVFWVQTGASATAFEAMLANLKEPEVIDPYKVNSNGNGGNNNNNNSVDPNS